jgi:hypothetical protein
MNSPAQAGSVAGQQLLLMDTITEQENLIKSGLYCPKQQDLSIPVRTGSVSEIMEINIEFR